MNQAFAGLAPAQLPVKRGRFSSAQSDSVLRVVFRVVPQWERPERIPLLKNHVFFSNRKFWIGLAAFADRDCLSQENEGSVVFNAGRSSPCFRGPAVFGGLRLDFIFHRKSSTPLPSGSLYVFNVCSGGLALMDPFIPFFDGRKIRKTIADGLYFRGRIVIFLWSFPRALSM